MINDKVAKFEEDPSDDTMYAIVELCKSNKLNYKDIAYLTKTLAYSGKQLKLNTKDKRLADIASTGGPSSLSTLITPVYLSALGFNVPKLGVKGRPAGAVDTMGRINNYKLTLDEVKIAECIKQSGFCHFIASENQYTPLDAKFFKFRSEHGGKKVPELVTASILSKKLAVGITKAGVDIRVSPFGNFGEDWDTARRNSKIFKKVAKMLGIDLKCFIYDGRYPYQNYIGRGEALLAIYKIINGSMNYELKKHVDICRAMCLTFVDKDQDNMNHKIKKIIKSNLTAQGSSYNEFMDEIHRLKNMPQTNIIASKKGFFKINLEKVRSAIVWGQRKYEGRDNKKYSDPCGIIVNKRANSYVESGDVLLKYRAYKKISDGFKKRIKSAYKITDKLYNDVSFKVI